MKIERKTKLVASITLVVVGISLLLDYLTIANNVGFVFASYRVSYAVPVEATVLFALLSYFFYLKGYGKTKAIGIPTVMYSVIFFVEFYIQILLHI